MPRSSVLVHDTDDLSPFKQRDLACRKQAQEDTAKGDPEARLLLRSFYHIVGWYNRDLGGDVIGELSKVAKEREGG